MYAVTERPAALARRDNRSTSRAIPSAFVAGSSRQNSTSLAMTLTHATHTRPTQIHPKQANQSNAYGVSIGHRKRPSHEGTLTLPRHPTSLCFGTKNDCEPAHNWTPFGRLSTKARAPCKGPEGRTVPDRSPAPCVRTFIDIMNALTSEHASTNFTRAR